MFVNMVLFVFKLVAGIIGRSGAMIADAVHSASDFATDIVVLAFVRISAKPRDDDHDWGHGKYETLASLIIGVALLLWVWRFWSIVPKRLLPLQQVRCYLAPAL